MNNKNDVCSVDGCLTAKYETRQFTKGMCSKHYQRWLRHGSTERLIGKRGDLHVSIDGYIVFDRGRNQSHIFHHTIIAEKALGKQLEKNAVIHHINGIRADNRPSNLVICQDNSYHLLIHTRQRALDECGKANYKKCTRCLKYDDPLNMYEYNKGHAHKMVNTKCGNMTDRNRLTRNEVKQFIADNQEMKCKII